MLWFFYEPLKKGPSDDRTSEFIIIIVGIIHSLVVDYEQR